MGVRNTSQRREKIAEMIESGQKFTIKELAEKYDVSRETIRKDLLCLREISDDRKTSVPDEVSGFERALNLRMSENLEKKRAIARAAAAIIPSGATIYLDSGSTTFELARCLTQIPDLTIVTNSAQIPEILCSCPSVVSCTGGTMRKSSRAFTGPWTLNVINSMHFDIAFLGTDGIDENGPCTAVLSEAEVKRAVVKNAYKTCVICDSTKLSKGSFVSVCSWSEISTMITDDKITEKQYRELSTHIDVIRAEELNS